MPQINLIDETGKPIGSSLNLVDETGKPITDTAQAVPAGPKIAPSLLASRQIASKSQFEENLPPSTVMSRARDAAIGALQPFVLENPAGALQGVGTAVKAALTGDAKTLTDIAKNAITAPLKPLSDLYDAYQKGDWNAAAEAAGGILTQTVPAVGMAGEALNPRGISLTGDMTSVGEARRAVLPLKTMARKDFGTVMQATRNVPAANPALQPIVDEIKTLAARGAEGPGIEVANKLDTALQGGPLTYEEARDFAQSAGKKVGTLQRLITPPDPRVQSAMGRLYGALQDASKGAADTQGLGDLFNQATSEYRRASQLGRAAKLGIGAALGYAGLGPAARFIGNLASISGF